MTQDIFEAQVKQQKRRVEGFKALWLLSSTLSTSVSLSRALHHENTFGNHKREARVAHSCW